MKNVRPCRNNRRVRCQRAHDSQLAYLYLTAACAIAGREEEGHAAAIICTISIARKRGLGARAVTVAATAIRTMQYGDIGIRIPYISAASQPTAPDYSEFIVAVKAAYEKAGIGPKDVDFIELQDNSVWQKLEMIELFGLCKPSEADRLLDHGGLDIGGKLPVNPSGGFQSFGEATTAMGVWHVFELTRQLRCEAGPNQVKGAKVGLSQTLGLGGNGAAFIFKR